MKTIRVWDDFKPYGLDLLTGESCAYMLRGLFDVTVAGRKLINEFFCTDMKLPENWNGGAFGSIMLPYEILRPLALFTLLNVDKCPVVYQMPGGVMQGVEAGEEDELMERIMRPHAARRD